MSRNIGPFKLPIKPPCYFKLETTEEDVRSAISALLPFERQTYETLGQALYLIDQSQIRLGNSINNRNPAPLHIRRDDIQRGLALAETYARLQASEPRYFRSLRQPFLIRLLQVDTDTTRITYKSSAHSDNQTTPHMGENLLLYSNGLLNLILNHASEASTKTF